MENENKENFINMTQYGALNKALFVNRVIDDKQVVRVFLNDSSMCYRVLHSATEVLELIISLQQSNYSIEFKYNQFEGDQIWKMLKARAKMILEEPCSEMKL